MNRALTFRTLSLAVLASLALIGCSDDDSDDEDTTSTGGTSSTGAGGGTSTGAGGGTSTGAGGGASTGAGGGSQTGSADTSMSFFVTSVGSGADGGNLGGLTGADARCQMLATAVGAGGKTWRAYLSTSTVNARDRIGSGPWFNQAGERVADSVADLHPAAGTGLSNGNPQHVLDETGAAAPGAQHDILTGSLPDGTVSGTLTCADWTSNSETLTDNPQVGHSDIPGNPMFSPSWNSAHLAANCSQAGLTQRGGAGRLYCFATN